MDLAEKILNGFPLSKPQRKFVVMLFTTILTLRGKVNFRNLSRYSSLSARTYQRWFDQPLDFIGLNRRLIEATMPPGRPRLLAFDPSFIPKAGKHTDGLASFWHGAHSRAEKGLELSAFSVVDLEYNTGYCLSVQQTLPPTDAADATLIDRYLAHLHAIVPYLQPEETHLAVDGEFAKKKWIDGVEAVGLHTIGKLRKDANMRFYYTGPPRKRGSGRQKVYEGKVAWQDLTRFDYVTDQDGLHLYTQILYHVTLQRALRVVVVVDRTKPQKPRQWLLFSTDLELDAVVLCYMYKARFQLEFLFRDAKQFTGLTDAQTRAAERLHCHFNAAMTTLNIAKIELRRAQPTQQPVVHSVASVKTGYFNAHYLQVVFANLGLNLKTIKNTPQYHFLREYGKIAA